MLGFLGDLTVIQQALAYIAVPSTVILLLQTILTLVGMGHGGSGVSTEGSAEGVGFCDGGCSVAESEGVTVDICDGDETDGVFSGVQELSISMITISDISILIFLFIYSPRHLCFMVL